MRTGADPSIWNICWSFTNQRKKKWDSNREKYNGNTHRQFSFYLKKKKTRNWFITFFWLIFPDNRRWYDYIQMIVLAKIYRFIRTGKSIYIYIARVERIIECQFSVLRECLNLWLLICFVFFFSFSLLFMWCEPSSVYMPHNFHK